MISTLYIVYDSNKNNIYKIGETIDLEKRIKQYRTYIPKIEIKFSIKTQYASQIEDIILRDFYDFREKKEDGLPTEWINKPLNEIINKIIYYTNNLSLFENINNENNCKWILKSGPNKGLNCGVKISENGFCKTHCSKINKDEILKKDYNCDLLNIDSKCDLPKSESNCDLSKLDSPKIESNCDSSNLNKEKIKKTNTNLISSESQKDVIDKTLINNIEIKEDMFKYIDKKESKNTKLINELKCQDISTLKKEIDKKELKELIILIKDYNINKTYDVNNIDLNIIFVEAIKNQHLNILYLFKKNNIKLQKCENEYLNKYLYAFNGDLENLKKIKNICFDSFVFSSATLNGNLENIKYLKLTNCPWDEWTFAYAALNGNLENIKWLKENSCPHDKWTFASTALNGNIENMKWLKENNFKWGVDTFHKAVENGNLENMKWLKKNKCPWSKCTFEYASLNGNLENMKWLKENGCPWSNCTFTYATKNGNLEIMKWLKENNCPWDELTFSSAAKNGNLENMKWLKENACPWNEETFSSAAKKGNLKNMIWLKENGCPWQLEENNYFWIKKNFFICIRKWKFRKYEMVKRKWLSLE